MDLDNKKAIIYRSKNNLSLLINEAINQIPTNIKNINEIIIYHNLFIDFVESMNIYENYKWEDIKITYNKVKKKINHDKKLYYKIVKIYGIINCYYSNDENKYYDIIINELYNTNNDMILEWENIKEIHNLLIKKRKIYIKNQNIVKVIIINDDINKIINRLYETYYKLKNIKNIS